MQTPFRKLLFSLLLPLLLSYWPLSLSSASCPPPSKGSYTPTPHVSKDDANLILLALNLEYLEAELFLNAAYGSGLDTFGPELAAGGPAPIGAQKANLDPLVLDLTQQLGLQEVGHIRAIKQTVGPSAFPRVQLDLSKEVFAATMDKALGMKLQPPFDPYADSIKFLIAIYLVPYVGLTGYVGASPMLSTPTAKRLVAGLLAVESGQDAVIRTSLYSVKDQMVQPYNITVAEFTDKISMLRNTLGHSGNVDEGLVVPKCLGAEGKISGNVLSADQNSVGYARTPAQILRVVYGTGNASMPGGFYPQGGKGFYADKYLHKADQFHA